MTPAGSITTIKRETAKLDWIVGSSHVLRWQSHIEASILPQTLPANRFIGYGGAPIWSKKNFDAITEKAGSSGRVGVLVPDFRFGNAVCLTDKMPDPIMCDGFEAIDPRAMSVEHDRAMLVRSLGALNLWHQKFGARARYLFWCLFGMQVQDRLAGRHITSVGYLHPVFNYKEISNALPELDIVDLSPLLRFPMHEVVRLFIDSSSHPTQIGYRLLDRMICLNQDAETAYKNAVAEVEKELFNYAHRTRAKYGCKVLLTGRSAWLDTLVRYMGATGTLRLAEAGLVLAPLNRAPGQPTIAQIMENLRAGACKALVFSSGGDSLESALAQAFGTDITAWRDIPHIDWETATEQIIALRHEKPRFAHPRAGTCKALRLIAPSIKADMLELGPLGLPTWRGLGNILEDIATGELEPNRVGGTRIEGDVLLTEDGVAFLVGGNHEVIKYATGERAPSLGSLENFNKNIVARAETARNAGGAAYAHVIFPDKQSVLSEVFPYKPVHKLGDAYRSKLSPELRNFVIYPADNLMQETNDPFLKVDSHMSDYGSLTVLRLMLEAVKIDAGSSLKRIEARIVKKRRWVGDLGAKFTPKLEQEAMVLDPDWPITQFRSPGGFNDGMIDLVFSPLAEHNRTVLLFGDSCFRVMLQHLSAIFTRVVCLRTRFLHSEMVTLIQPDVIFTGNAERYLSAVTSDLEAHAFPLYSVLRDAPFLASDTEFLDAWRAITSPRASHSHALFSRYELPRRSF